MAEGIGQTTGALAVELVFDRLFDSGPGLDRAFEESVNVWNPSGMGFTLAFIIKRVYVQFLPASLRGTKLRLCL